jgi:hypothetical protein
MSEFKNFSEKNFRFLLRRIREEVDPFERGTDLISGNSKKGILNILDDIGMSADSDDLSFIFSLYRLNPNFETEPIKIPKLHTYEIYTRRQAVISVEELWKSQIESYFENEDDVKTFEEWFGIVDWWEGDMVDRDEVNEETTDTEIDDINKIS